MKKKDKIGKINMVLWTIAILLTIVTLAISLIGYFSFGFRTFNQNPSISELETNPNENINISESIYRGVLLSSGAVDNPNLITATVEGMEGIDKTLNWELGWKTQSSWATDKNVNNYIGLVINPDTLSVLVENKAPFAEPIIVTARSTTRNDVFGSCTIDYLKKITKFEKTSSDSKIVVGYNSKETNTGVNIATTINYSEGTLTPEITCTLNVKYNTAMVNQINETLANNGINGSISKSKTKNIQYNNGVKFDFSIASDITKGPLAMNSAALDLINDLFIDNSHNLQWYCSLSMDVQISYENVGYKTYTYDLGKYTFDASTLTNRCATSVKLDKNQMIF